MCGCMAWSPRCNHYRLLLTVHHRLLVRVLGTGASAVPTGSFPRAGPEAGVC